MSVHLHLQADCFSIRSGSFATFPVTASVHPGRRDAGSQANQQNAHTALLRLCPSVYCRAVGSLDSRTRALQWSTVTDMAFVPHFFSSRPTCAAFAAQSKRSEEIGKGSSYYLAEHEQQTWRIPVGLFVDIPRLREIVPVITVGEYLRYHHLPPSLEKINGHWDVDNYRMLPGFAGGPAKKLSPGIVRSLIFPRLSAALF